VARSALPASFVARPAEELYRPPNYYGRGGRHPPDPSRVMTDPDPGPDGPDW